MSDHDPARQLFAVLVYGSRVGRPLKLSLTRRKELEPLPEPRAVLAEIVRVAALGAMVFVRDLLRPASNAAVDALVAQYAADGNARQRKLFDDSLRAALTLEEMRTIIAELGVDRETVQQTTDRHWTWAYRKVDR